MDDKINEKHEAADMDITKTQAVKKHNRPVGRLLKIMTATLGVALVIVGMYVGYTYASSPVSIREPLLEHYHFRMQVIVNGKTENFAESKYQTPYANDSCNAALPSSPIHFHDKRDQFVHIHWEGITGGQVLKYYGWNMIGGMKGSLGSRFDDLPKLQKIPIHGTTLPTIPGDANFYVYTQKDGRAVEKKFADFTRQDLEQFFGKTSNFPAHKLNQEKRSLLDSIRNALIPKAQAQDSHKSSHGEMELKRINNLLGDVVLFVQKDKPSEQQVKRRFDNLVPLGDSTCGG